MLTIKEVAAYLPYGVGVYWEDLICDLNGIDGNTVIIGCYNVDLDQFKILLRPLLSDLTKEIEHNGERFVPHIELQKLNVGHSDWVCKEYNTWIKKYGYEYWFNHIPVGIYQKLLEWHFDIFNRIPDGSAIDLNTIK